MAKITSLTLHIVSLALLLLLTSRSLRPPAAAVPELRPTPLYLPVLHSGGSNHTDQPTSPRRAAPEGAAHFHHAGQPTKPKTAMPITVAFDSPTFVLDTIGDPSSSLLAGKLRTFRRKQYRRPRVLRRSSAPGLQVRAPRHSITPPQLIYKVEPEFSEEARKAKYQGTVVLAMEVGPPSRQAEECSRAASASGTRPRRKGDEEASQARWRFRLPQKTAGRS